MAADFPRDLPPGQCAILNLLAKDNLIPSSQLNQARNILTYIIGIVFIIDLLFYRYLPNLLNLTLFISAKQKSRPFILHTTSNTVCIIVNVKRSSRATHGGCRLHGQRRHHQPQEHLEDIRRRQEDNVVRTQVLSCPPPYDGIPLRSHFVCTPFGLRCFVLNHVLFQTCGCLRMPYDSA